VCVAAFVAVVAIGLMIWVRTARPEPTRTVCTDDALIFTPSRPTPQGALSAYLRVADAHGWHVKTAAAGSTTYEGVVRQFHGTESPPAGSLDPATVTVTRTADGLWQASLLCAAR
jgi:hypothetical protein